MKILVLNRDIIFDQVTRGLEANGHEVTAHGKKDDYKLPLGELLRLLGSVQPDFCLLRNRRVLDRGFNPHGPQIESYLQANHVPHVSWFTENPLSCGTADSTSYFYLRGHRSCLNLTFSEESTATLQAMGHRAEYLPIAVSPDIFRPPEGPAPEYAYDVSFIGRPKMGLPGQCSPDRLGAATLPHLLSRCRSALEFFSGQICRSLGEGSLRTLERTPSVTLDTFDEIAGTYRRHLEAYLVNPLEAGFMVVAARLGMIKVLRWLVDAGIPIKLFGGDEWRQFFPGEQETPIISYEDQPTVYARSRINLVLSKLELRDVAHERILNIAACKAFSLAEHRPAIRRLFSEEEVPTFRDRTELVELCRYYLDHNTLRQEMAARAYERVMRDHTFTVRMGRMAEIVSAFLRKQEAKQPGAESVQDEEYQLAQCQ